MENKAIFITNIPAPYRELVHKLAYEKLAKEYAVIYCSHIEDNRKWNFESSEYNKLFLKSHSIKINGRTIYLSSDILSQLRSLDPDVIIIGGFSLPMIVSYFWALKNNKKVISFTDANLDSESSLSFLHVFVRKFFYGKSHACIGASKKSLELYKSYGVDKNILFQSHLCADNILFTSFYREFEKRDFDILLCGQMIPSKMFDFSLDVISGLTKFNKNIKVKLLGSGPLREHILARLEKIGVSYDYPGFIEQAKLPLHYSKCKVFLFPSLKDAWGVVANEALAAGTPVITTPIVGAADELILDGLNGFVCDANISVWVERCLILLTNKILWSDFSNKALESVKDFNFEAASNGIVDAVNCVREQNEK